MPQLVSRQLLTVEPKSTSGSVHVGFVVDREALGQVFSEFFGFPVSIIPP
jgi:hypothetical protein